MDLARDDGFDVLAKACKVLRFKNGSSCVWFRLEWLGVGVSEEVSVKPVVVVVVVGAGPSALVGGGVVGGVGMSVMTVVGVVVVCMCCWARLVLHALLSQGVVGWNVAMCECASIFRLVEGFVAHSMVRLSALKVSALSRSTMCGSPGQLVTQNELRAYPQTKFCNVVGGPLFV